MKISILRPIVLGALVSTILTACSTGGGDDGGRPDKPCLYNIDGGNAVDIMFGTSYENPSIKVSQDGEDVPYKLEGSVDTGKLGINKMTYSSESCSNDQVRTVTVVESSCAYKLLGGDPLEVALNSTYKELGVEVKDINNKIIEYKITGTVDTSKADDYLLTYQGIGCDDSQKRVVKVKATSTECKYDIKGLTVSLNSAEINLKDGITVTGADDKEINNITITPDKVSTSKAGEYSVTYKGEDCPNEEIRTITIEAPVNEPIACQYELEGGNAIDVTVGGDYNDPEYSLKDIDNKPVEKGELKRTGELKLEEIGKYELVYKDSHCKDSVTRTVNVVANDCTYSFADGKNPLKLNFGATYDASVNKPTVKDSDDAEISASDVTVNTEKSDTVDTAKAGIYTVVYEAKDCPNDIPMTVEVSALSCTYTLKDGSSTVLKGNTYNDPGVSVTPEVKITTTGTIDTSTSGSQTITYQGEGCGESITRTVEVKELTEDELKDMLLPTI